MEIGANKEPAIWPTKTAKEIKDIRGNVKRVLAKVNNSDGFDAEDSRVIAESLDSILNILTDFEKRLTMIEQYNKHC